MELAHEKSVAALEQNMTMRSAFAHLQENPKASLEMIEERDPRVADGQSMFPTARVSEQTDIKCDPCDVAFNCAD